MSEHSPCSSELAVAAGDRMLQFVCFLTGVVDVDVVAVVAVVGVGGCV